MPTPDLLASSLELAQTQLVGQLADETSLDGRSMGSLGFSGALLASVVAAKDILGPAWWVPLIPVAVAAGFCLGPALGIGSNFGADTDLGPGAEEFYATYAGQPAPAAREQLLADLGAAFETNARRLRAKRRALRRALSILAIGLVASAVAIELNRPSNIGSITVDRPNTPNLEQRQPLAPAPIRMPAPSGVPHVGPTGPLPVQNQHSK